MLLLLLLAGWLVGWVDWLADVSFNLTWRTTTDTGVRTIDVRTYPRQKNLAFLQSPFFFVLYVVVVIKRMNQLLNKKNKPFWRFCSHFLTCSRVWNLFPNVSKVTLLQLYRSGIYFSLFYFHFFAGLIHFYSFNIVHYSFSFASPLSLVFVNDGKCQIQIRNTLFAFIFLCLLLSFFLRVLPQWLL